MIQFHLIKSLNGSHGKLALNVELEVRPGEILGLMGVSGAGKTSLLRMLAGLLPPDKGYIRVDGDFWYHNEKKISCSARARRVGYVFQQYALFPHMTVKQNLQFALPEEAPKQSAELWLEKVGLTSLSHQKPGQLSGGQQQRVALVRALARNPKVLLLDEPLTAQDQKLRRHLQADLKLLLSEAQVGTILVSHDPAEITQLADRVAILEGGQITKYGLPTEVLNLQDEIQGQVIAIDHQAQVAIITIGRQSIRIPLQADLETGDLVSVSLISTQVKKLKG